MLCRLFPHWIPLANFSVPNKHQHESSSTDRGPRDNVGKRFRDVASSPTKFLFKEKHLAGFPFSAPGLVHKWLCCPRQDCAVRETRAPASQVPDRGRPLGSRSRQSFLFVGPQFPQMPNEESKKDPSYQSQKQESQNNYLCPQATESCPYPRPSS